ncbi:MAG: two-component regulator propeller domain-containing protein [Anaerolineales bacterium]
MAKDGEASQFGLVEWLIWVLGSALVFALVAALLGAVVFVSGYGDPIYAATEFGRPALIIGAVVGAIAGVFRAGRSPITRFGCLGSMIGTTLGGLFILIANTSSPNSSNPCESQGPPISGFEIFAFAAVACLLVPGIVASLVAIHMAKSRGTSRGVAFLAGAAPAFIVPSAIAIALALFVQSDKSFDESETGWRVYTLEQGRLSTIHIMPDGQVWIGTSSGVATLSGDSWEFLTQGISELQGNEVTEIARDGTGRIWVGAYGPLTGPVTPSTPHPGGLTIYDTGSWTSFTSQNSPLATNVVYNIAFDQQGRAWIQTGDFRVPSRGGIQIYDGDSWTTITPNGLELDADSYVGGIDFDQQGNAWVGSEHGLFVFAADMSWEHFTVDNSGLPDNRVTAVAVDESGSAWVGTMDGLGVYDGISWTSYTPSNSGLADPWVFDVEDGRTGKVWIGTYSGLSSFDGNSWATFRANDSGLASNDVLDIAIDNEGLPWVVGGMCVSRLLHSDVRSEP